MIKMIKGNETHANSYVICRFDQCVIIDPSYHLPEILDAIGERKTIGVLLTHAHDDHMDLIESFDCPIYIHKDDAYLMFEDRYNGYHDRKRPYHKKNLELILIEDEDKIKLADQFILCIHTPGHTKGSTSYLYQSHIFTGDTLFKESVGRHDLYSGSLPKLKQSVLKIMALNNQVRIYPGHDDKTDIRYEKKHNPFYIKWYKQFHKD